MRRRKSSEPLKTPTASGRSRKVVFGNGPLLADPLCAASALRGFRLGDYAPRASSPLKSCGSLKGMETPEKQPIIYKSGTSPALGAGWDVMLVQTGKGSVALARDANGEIMRKADSVPETWEVVRDEETLRVCRKYFDHRDKMREEQAAAEDTATFD
jgi:hypothetical protein